MKEHYLTADRITAVSKFVHDRIDMILGCGAKIDILYDCVDTSYFHPSAIVTRSIRRELDIDDSSFVVLCVARFSASKRHRILIQAFCKVMEVVSDATLVLVGEPDIAEPKVFDNALDLISELRVDERVRIVNFDCDIRSYEQAADVVILCSIDEALGTVVLESMALGKAVIVSDSGGLPEMIENEVSGLICRADHVQSLAEHLLRIYRDKALARELGMRARRVAVERFSLGVHRRKLGDVYSQFGIRLASESEMVEDR